MSEFVPGFSDDFVFLIASCGLTAGVGYAFDIFLPQLVEKFLCKRRVRGTVSKFLALNPTSPASFSDTATAVTDGRLPTCPICLEYVRHAIETSWCEHFSISHLTKNSRILELCYAHAFYSFLL
jgi:hypothetical protein